MPRNALLVIDVQKVYTSRESELYCKDCRGTVRRINSLIDTFAAAHDLLIFVRHVHRPDGSDLGRMFDYRGEPTDDFKFKEGSKEVEYDDELRVPANATHLTKNRYSAFVGTTLQEVLQEHRIDTVTVCGFMTNFCCESTARQAHDLDYFVDFVVDATGSPGTDKFSETEIRKVVSGLLSAGYARVSKTSSMLKRSARSSDR